jgi:hypothetical protein
MSYEEKIRWPDDTGTAVRTNRNTQIKRLCFKIKPDLDPVCALFSLDLTERGAVL